EAQVRQCPQHGCERDEGAEHRACHCGQQQARDHTRDDALGNEVSSTVYMLVSSMACAELGHRRGTRVVTGDRQWLMGPSGGADLHCRHHITPARDMSPCLASELPAL